MIGMLDGVLGEVVEAEDAGHSVYFLHNEIRASSWLTANKDRLANYRTRYKYGWWYPETPEGFTPLAMENV